MIHEFGDSCSTAENETTAPGLIVDAVNPVPSDCIKPIDGCCMQLEDRVLLFAGFFYLVSAADEFVDLGSLTHSLTQIVELRPPYTAFSHYFDLLNAR